MKLEKKLSKEQKTINRHNCRLAWAHFYPEGNGVSKKGYCLHHIDDSLRHTDIERYIQWNVEDLQMMTNAEHSSLHKKGKPTWNKGKTLSEEHRRKMSESHKGIPKNEEHCAKLSESLKGRHIYYDKDGQRFRLFEDDTRVINKEVVTLEEYRKLI